MPAALLASTGALNPLSPLAARIEHGDGLGHGLRRQRATALQEKERVGRRGSISVC